VRARVARVLATRAWDVVHAEQLQAFAACDTAATRGLPVVLRAQNVESALWDARAARPGFGRAGRRWEAARVARFEGAAVRHAAATVALTRRDADRLAALAGGATRVHHLPAPFPAAGRAAGRALAGDPAVALPGSTGWPPNAEAAAWFTRTVWPVVAARLPAARLHLFGTPLPSSADPTIASHAAPEESADLFPAGAIVVIPLRTAVGVRMRILEAWARGVPVVATPAALAGLDDDAAQAVLPAASADEMAAAIATLAADAAARQRVIAAGAALLRARHDPATIAGELARVYASVAGG
jgi:glycosyltransferase involved in cell wall biosynthesis